MTDKREKIKTKVLFISVSVILFHFSNGKIYNSSDLLDGLFQVEVTNVLIIAFIIIYLYYFIRFFVLRNEYEFKNMFIKINQYRIENRLYRLLIRRKALKEINNIKPIENTQNDDLKRFTDKSISIDKNHKIRVTNKISRAGNTKGDYHVEYQNIDLGKSGFYKVKTGLFTFYFFTLFSYPKYLLDDYFWETILPYITFIWSFIIILSYVIGINEIIILSE